MPTPVLYDFIATVPSCPETTRLGAVLQIFNQGQCDRLVVVNQQRCPVGVVKLQRLLPRLMTLSQQGGDPEGNIPLSVDLDFVEPIVTIPDQLSVEQFGAYLRTQPAQPNTSYEWALVDPDGKFLGLLDSQRLLHYLAISADWSVGTHEERELVNRHKLSSVVQLIERLPWPLMLQTGNAEIITQNPVWRQHFQGLGAPEAVRREVEAIQDRSFASQAPGRIQNYIFTTSSVYSSLRQGHPQVTSAYILDSDVQFLSLTSASNQCQLDAQSGSYICVFPGQNGQERIWQFTKIALHVSGGSSELKNEQIWLLLAHDITKEQQLASELAAKNADVIHLNRLKDEFLACISHELKTPLTAVLGLSSLLKDQLLGELNERQARYARLIHQSGRHLMTVVNDILDLTRMETGQMELTLQPVQIVNVCERAIQQARAIQPETKQPSQARETLEERSCDHRFTLLIEPGLDSLVADELRLRQMLVHLLANAFKFTETGGEISLQVNRWEGWIAFTVWDTGIGIPENHQHLIFQKFQQLENPLSRQFEGTGLGLVLTRALARLHGGDVSFLSKAGKGSQFTLLLPPSPPRKRAGGTLENHRSRLILVVEAAPRFIEELTEQLTSLGYQFVIARSGTEALEKARRLQPGAVFLNPLLPLLSGWDVLTLLKSDAATCQIPVIVTATCADREQAFSNRADDFLSLPVQQQGLQHILARFCAMVPGSKSGKGSSHLRSSTPLTILRLVTPEGEFPETCSSSPANYRVLEAHDLEQAELLARFWQPDVVLIAQATPDPLAYLKQLSHYPSLKSLPLVTLDAAITQAANQVSGLSVFPCLKLAQDQSIDALLPILEIAAGMSCKPNLLVVDLTTLSDLPEAQARQTAESTALSRIGVEGSEWFQALIQYLQTAGLGATIGRSWAEVLQQVQQQSVDLLLICLGYSRLHPSILAALTDLGQQNDLPPVLVMDQRKVNHSSDAVASLDTVLGAIATRILPPSLSMEQLLAEINQTLTATR